MYLFSYRPGGELIPGEDQVEGLKRLLTEVCTGSFKYYHSKIVTSLLGLKSVINDILSSDVGSSGSATS